MKTRQIEMLTMIFLGLLIGPSAPAASAADQDEQNTQQHDDAVVETSDNQKKDDQAVLKDLKHEKMNRQAPEKFRVHVETSQGDFIVEVVREWSPVGVDRFYNLVDNGFYDGCRFFRVLEGFVAQVGIHSDPEISKVWRSSEAQIKDDPVKQSNTRGMITYAKTNAPNSRTVQIFINYKDNSQLDRMGFAPFGKVVDGMSVVEKLYADYGEGAPRGAGPDQQAIQMEGESYLKKEFPKLDYIKRARIEKDENDKQ